MKASVIVPTYNQIDLLRECLKSLEVQALDRGDFEVIVVNDGSRDETSTFLECYQPGFTLKVINHPENLGRAQARNSGAQKAQGEVLIFLDGDCTVTPDFVAEHLRGREADPNAVCLGNLMLPSGLGEVPFRSYLSTRGVRKLKHPESVPFRYFISGNISVGRELFERVGGFDTDFTFYGGEDLELGLRLHKAGAKFSFLPGAISCHHLQDDLREAIHKKYIFGNRALPLVLEKHPESATELPVVKLSKSPIFRLLVAGLFYRPLVGLATILEKSRFPDFFFDYLFHGATIRGLTHLKQGLREPASAELRGSKALLWAFVLWVLFANIYYYINFALSRFERLELLSRFFLSLFR